jgi:predicted transcriptional regulator
MEEELVEKLKFLGLTDGEARVYLALLYGESTKSGIVRKSGISPSIVYKILERLIRKGLVSSITVNGKNYFQANEPTTLFELLKKEEENLEGKKAVAKNLVSTLKRKKSEKTFFVSVYEGLDGLKSILREVEEEEFKNKRTKYWLAMGVTAYKKSFNLFWANWHLKVRPKYNVKAKFIFCEKGTEYFNLLKSAPLSEVKYIPSLPCITIVGERVILMKYTDPPSFLLIKNPDIARAFENFFNTVWKMRPTNRSYRL